MPIFPFRIEHNQGYSMLFSPLANIGEDPSEKRGHWLGIVRWDAISSTSTELVCEHVFS